MDNFLIEKNDLDIAQQVCNFIENGELRNRALANTFASNISSKFFEDIDIELDNSSGLHSIPHILEELDISDIYIDGVYFDVRLSLNENEICVPKSHFDYDMLPFAYMFINVSADLSNGKVIGFIKPEDINKVNLHDEKFYITMQDLKTFDEVSCNMQPSKDISLNDADIFGYTENSIKDRITFYRALLQSKESRIKLQKAIKAESIFNLISMPKSEIPEEGNNIEVELTNDNEYNNSETELLNDDNELENMFDDENIQVQNDTSQTNNFKNNNTNDINSLYEQHAAMKNTNTSQYNNSQSKNSSPFKFIFSLIFISVIVVGGYYGYNFYKENFSQSNNDIVSVSNIENSIPVRTKEENDVKPEDVMPNENVNIDEVKESTEEANSDVTIPAIEKNLDASILVQNLKVNWEVPAGLAPSTSAQRYFVNLGKVIQLNLKTEMLLLSKPPITNKIVVEIQYNNKTNSFGNVSIITSSGEKLVDDVVLQTIDRIIKMKSNVTPGLLGSVDGNPMLIIRF